MITPLLSLRSLRKRFGSLDAVQDLSLDLGEGEYFCLLGPSGCGKSTLMRIVAGFEQADGGQVLLRGKDLAGVVPQQRPLNMVFQHYALFPHLSVAENIVFGLRMRRADAATRQRELERMLALTGLEGLAGRLPRQLSGGQQQRVALARAIVNRPALLLLDEPLAALDKQLRQQMQAELRRLQAETGITFLHVTHDQQEALSLADRLGVMHRGRLLQAGPPAELYERPQWRFVAAFLGESNLFPARREEGGLRISPQLPPLRAREAPPGEQCHCLIRPEHIRFAAQGEASGANTFPGQVAAARYQGATRAFDVEAGGLRFQVLCPAQAGLPAPGESVSIAIDPAQIVLIPERDAEND
jgi:ABC-type Fe3+/spermidine/putrescine transport system ATPase subunit